MRRAELAGAALLSIAIAVHAWSKMQLGLLPETLWSCNVSAILIVAGVLIDRREVTSVAWLTFVSVGLGAWLLDLLSGSQTSPAAVVIHLLAPIVGLLHVRRKKLWRRSVPAALALHVALYVVSLGLTPPELNINQAHSIWPPVASWFSTIWLYQVANFAIFTALLLAGFALLRATGLVAGEED